MAQEARNQGDSGIGGDLSMRFDLARRAHDLTAAGEDAKRVRKLTGLSPKKLEATLAVDRPHNIVPFSEFDLIPPPDDGLPAMMVYDIETAPALAWVWQQYDANVIGTERDWYVLCFVYKWLRSDEIGFISIRQDPAFVEDTNDDAYVVERLASLFDRADVLIAHNGDRFDQKKTNSRIAAHNIWPPSPYESVDTLKVAKREMKNMANNLNELSRVYGLGGKVAHTGFAMWRACMRGDEEAWDVMEAYNREDVLLLERLYERLRPWMGLPGKPKHPNLNLFVDEEYLTHVCSKCGHAGVEAAGEHRTASYVYAVVRCKSCGAQSKLRKSLKRENPLGAV